MHVESTANDVCYLFIIAINRAYSNEFQTLFGISQGVTSSSIIFLSFMDDLIQYLKEKCAPENLIGEL